MLHISPDDLCKCWIVNQQKFPQGRKGENQTLKVHMDVHLHFVIQLRIWIEFLEKFATMENEDKEQATMGMISVFIRISLNGKKDDNDFNKKSVHQELERKLEDVEGNLVRVKDERDRHEEKRESLEGVFLGVHSFPEGGLV